MLLLNTPALQLPTDFQHLSLEIQKFKVCRYLLEQRIYTNLDAIVSLLGGG
jgi:hypothetical protein